ncbi:restriction endonuclease subunit S [Mesomycoplasma lagogenitalium]|uniref:Restriction endonuclease subunit S n=1 Tax=Mesomycoplasma lagogenitalium TaxID=171286 RepID=A0ABY8LSR6_9BACT|nr:restriction endonuclease subunit S [Mesomycoplasma lagogenitalium]WGI36307.1 restriction endonuclease subunit S [Mesomycoplasma lagogenitalium]
MKKFMQLLKNEKIEWKTLGEVCEIKSGETISKQVILKNPGIYPVINSGMAPLGYISFWNVENDPIGITSRGSGVGSITYQTGRYFRGNLNYSVSINNQKYLNTRFLYHLLLNYQGVIRKICTFNAIPALNTSELKKIKIPIPSLKTQEKIVQILDNLSNLKNELNNELNSRIKQYEYYRDKLLSEEYLNKITYNLVLDTHTHTHTQNHNEFSINSNKILPEKAEISLDQYSNSINKKFIWELTIWDKKFSGVKSYKQKNVYKYKYFLANEINKLKDEDGKIKILTTNKSNIFANENKVKNFIVDREIVYIPGGGNPIVQYYNGKFITSDNRIATSIDKNILSNKFLYYYFENNIEKVKEFYRGSGIKHPDMSKILDMEIWLPPLELQNKIVAILDKFQDAIENSKGLLPQEIELRKMQYEYYRDKLLSFNIDITSERERERESKIQ